MQLPAPTAADGTRLSEVLSAFAFANDLAFGLARDDSIRSCYLAIRIGELLECSPEDQRTIYYSALLKDAGCTSWTSTLADFWGTDEIAARRELMIFGNGESMPAFFRWLLRYVGSDLPLHRRVSRAFVVAAGQREIAREGFEATCDVAMRIAQRLGMTADVQAAVSAMFEHWDGNGMPDGQAASDIPLSSRVIFPTFTLAPVAHRFGREAAIALAQEQRSRAFDPDVSDAFLAVANDDASWRELEAPDLWERVLDREPRPHPTPLTEHQLDEVVLAFADFTDLKAPHMLAHSRRVGALAETIAQQLGCADALVTTVRRAGLVYDLGLVAVPSWVLEKPDQMRSEAEREQLRLQPYYAERILGRIPALAPLATIVGTDRDQHGHGSKVSLPAQIVAIAARLDELTHDAPGHTAMAPEDALASLEASVYGPDILNGLQAAVRLAQARPEHMAAPAGLTEREVEVLRLAARGHTRREIGRQLQISEITVRHHLEHIYSKAGVSNRASAALFAMEQGLLD